MDDFITDFSTRVINNGLATWGTMRGCRDYEIQGLENYFGIELPEVYKDFLKKMGKAAGKFMQGTDLFYNHLFDNRKAMLEVLELDGHPFSLNETEFIFSSHQGYIFHFFDTAEDAFDPPVYGYKEGDLKTKRINESFSSFLSEVLDDEIDTWNKINH